MEWRVDVDGEVVFDFLGDGNYNYRFLYFLIFGYIQWSQFFYEN